MYILYIYILSLLIQMMMMKGDNLVYINVNAESLRFFEAVNNVGVIGSEIIYLRLFNCFKITLLK